MPFLLEMQSEPQTCAPPNCALSTGSAFAWKAGEPPEAGWWWVEDKWGEQRVVKCDLLTAVPHHPRWRYDQITYDGKFTGSPAKKYAGPLLPPNIAGEPRAKRVGSDRSLDRPNFEPSE